MNEQNIGTGVESRNLWDHLEDFVRGHIPQFIQRLLVEEVTMRLGRAKSERLVTLEVVYVGADGLYVKAGLEHSKAALLVLIGALTDGRKVVWAVESG